MARSTARIAIVDDDAGLRSALVRLLAASAMDTVAYASGESFLASLETQSPACVVLDLKMPGMTGFEVLRRLADSGMRMPVIVLAADDAPETEHHCRQAGAAAYLRKPCDGDLLLATITRAIAARETPRR